MSRYSADQRRRNESSSSLWFFNNVDRRQQHKVVAEEGAADTVLVTDIITAITIAAPTAIDIADIDLAIAANGRGGRTQHTSMNS